MFIILAQFGLNLPSVYQEIASVLRARGHTVWIARLNDANQLEVENGSEKFFPLRKETIPTARIFRWPVFSQLAQWVVEWIFAMHLRRYIRQTQPDVMHINRARLGFFWLIPLWAKGNTRYVLDWRQIVEREYNGLLGKFKQFLFAQYRRIPSRYIYDRSCFLHPAGARQLLGVEWQRWGTVVPLAVSDRFLQDFDKGPVRVDQKPVVRFIYIGTLNRRRRLDRIIMAVKELQSLVNNCRDYEITFIGHDDSNGLLQSTIAEFDLDSVIRIEPPVPYEHIPSILKQHDVALAIVPEHPLDWKYHPTLKILEYRAVGMPIIATDFEPNRELVEEGINGLLVSNTPEDIAQAMKRFVGEDGFLQACASNAQEMRQGLLWKDVGEMYEKLYWRLLQEEQ